MKTPLVALVIALVIVALVASTTSAQRRPRQQTQSEALAALAVHEEMWDHPDGVAAILAVWRHIAETRHLSVQVAAREHSPRFFAGTSTRSWTRRLTRDAHKPEGMGQMLRWDLPRIGGQHELPPRRDQWLIYLARADAALVATSVCVADTWGNAADWRAASDNGHCYAWVDCGDTLNHFGVWRSCDSTEPDTIHPGSD